MFNQVSDFLGLGSYGPWGIAPTPMLEPVPTVEPPVYTPVIVEAVSSEAVAETAQSSVNYELPVSNVGASDAVSQMSATSKTNQSVGLNTNIDPILILMSVVIIGAAILVRKRS